ncbi:hypothetical protein [Rossellomorea aquimaris]|uniref:Uncharacterized protein n=1 Tax=Rossellomorea aquimaris TaxID=189382 RepID=A0A366ESR1_9BACI|nr:hypothetical protein [Rossellomorea aquimaris]RBP04966.1 hypothetical protein DET59_105256 [Rossellomorea aquimaris]
MAANQASNHTNKPIAKTPDTTHYQGEYKMTDNNTTEATLYVNGNVRKDQTSNEEAFLNQVMQLMSKAIHDWEQGKVAREKDG